jgi:hypothetical protein
MDAGEITNSVFEHSRRGMMPQHHVTYSTGLNVLGPALLVQWVGHLVETFRGVPTARLDPSDPAVVAWADEVQARCNAGEGYVSRETLEKQLAACRDAHKVRTQVVAVAAPPPLGFNNMPGDRDGEYW